MDGRLDFERPEEQPVLSPDLARLLLRLAVRRLEADQPGDGREAA